MGKKKGKKLRSSTAESSEQICREKLPKELEARLHAVWSKIGHLVEWCDDAGTWAKMFCSEARPYRETFYWEAVAKMVSDYMAAHAGESPEMALADYLIATQSRPYPDDSKRMSHFREAWQQTLDRSRKEIEAFIEADLDLAMWDGTYQTVAALYAADYQRWKKGEEKPG